MPDETKEHPPGVDTEKGRIKFDYIKSNYFRAIHVDGVFGGTSPSGLIRMSVWNERWPIPKQTISELKEDGSVGREIREERISRDAIVREIETDLVMDVETAVKIRNWLDDKVKNLLKVKTQSEDGGTE